MPASPTGSSRRSRQSEGGEDAASSGNRLFAAVTRSLKASIPASTSANVATEHVLAGQHQ